MGLSLRAVFGSPAPHWSEGSTWKTLNLSSQGEYVANTNDRTKDFFYSWDEVVYSPRSWFHTGFALQHTRAYQAPVDLQPGGSFGFVHKRWDFTTYIFDAGLNAPTAVLGLAYSF